MDSKEVILIVGDVKGRLKVLFSKVNAVIKKCGRFDSIFCVGDFFGESCKDWDLYVKGIEKAPIQTYILGPLKDEQFSYYGDLSGCELAPNISHLGNYGVLTTGKGLRIAYLSGVDYVDSNIKCKLVKENFIKLRDLCRRGNLTYNGVDLLLSSQWPNGVTELDKNAKYKPLKGSSLLSWLVAEIMPRYHICGLEGVAYERPPFIHMGDNNKTLTSTRFVALGPVGNPSKDRWIYALNLKPLRYMTPNEAGQQTTDQTPIPFRNINELKSDIEGSNQYFFNTEPQKRTLQQNSENKKRHKATPQSECWFCLSAPKVEKHLIVSVGKHCYLALAKGGLVEEHLIISTISHHESTAVISESARIEIFHFKEVLKTYFAKKNQAVVFFERNFKTVHLQIQVVPLPKSLAGSIKNIYQKAAENQSMRLDSYPKGTRCYLNLPPKSQYFYVELPDGEELIAKIEGNFPMQFGRDVLVQKDALNMKDKGDWHNCLQSKDKEAKMAETFRKRFMPYDFTLEEK